MLQPIVLVPMGGVAATFLADLGSGLQRCLGVEVRLGLPLEVPQAAYWPERGQYLAQPLLSALKGCPAEAAHKVLGIADVDLYAPGLNFVFGMAAPPQGMAVISLARLRPEWYGRAPDSKLLLNRALKEAVHELGHLYGLGHCPNPKCVMHFSNSLTDTDVKGAAFCPRCHSSVRPPGLDTGANGDV